MYEQPPCPEKAVICSVFMGGNSTFSDVAFLDISDFANKQLAEVWEIVRDLIASNSPVDLITVSEKLRNNQSDIGIVFLTELFQYLPSSAHAEYYAKIVKERSVRRRVRGEYLKIAEKLSKGGDAHNLAFSANTSVEGILSELSSQEYLTTKELSIIAKKALEVTYGGNGGTLPTGFYDIDAMLNGGFRPKTLNYLAARPSMGKTALALCLAVNMGEKHNGAIFSLETGNIQLIHRTWAANSKVNFSHMTEEKGLTEHDFPKLYRAMEKVGNTNLFWFDAFNMTIPQIVGHCKKLKEKRGLDFIIIDYLQLINDSRKTDTQNIKIGEFSRQLKGMAGQLDIVVVCLSQLNRALEKREDKRPMLSDLRDSGSLEQDADTVMFIYRGKVYKKRGEKEDEKIMNDDENVAEIIIAKNKEGRTGTAKLLFLEQYTLFENLQKF